MVKHFIRLKVGVFRNFFFLEFLYLYSNLLTFFLQGKDEGSIKIVEGEEFEVIELDQGDGWTRVRRKDRQMSYEEGFVPTSYIQVDLFNK